MVATACSQCSPFARTREKMIRMKEAKYENSSSNAKWQAVRRIIVGSLMRKREETSKYKKKIRKNSSEIAKHQPHACCWYKVD